VSSPTPGLDAHLGRIPADAFPCAACAGEAAARAVYDAFMDLYAGRDFPSGQVGAFDNAFGKDIKRMAVWAMDAAETATKRDDNEACALHRRGPDDEA